MKITNNIRSLNFFTSARLFMRRSNDESDLKEYLSYLDKSDYENQFGLPYSEELEQAISFTNYGVINFSMIEKSSGKMIGYVGLLPMEEDKSCAEIEFHVFKPYRGKGYCQEASAALLRHFFAGNITGVRGECVRAEIVWGNIPSEQILRNLGFTRTSTGFRVNVDPEDEEHTYSITVLNFELSLEDFRPYVIESDILPAS